MPTSLLCSNFLASRAALSCHCRFSFGSERFRERCSSCLLKTLFVSILPGFAGANSGCQNIRAAIGDPPQHASDIAPHVETCSGQVRKDQVSHQRSIVIRTTVGENLKAISLLYFEWMVYKTPKSFWLLIPHIQIPTKWSVFCMRIGI